MHLADGTTLAYDVLVVATGARLVPEETEGLTGPGRMDEVFTFYDLDGATALPPRWRFDGGRIVVNVVDMPIKCPVAPLEFCFLADWYFTERGIRDRVELTYVTPLDGAFTKPVAVGARCAACCEEHGIELVTEFNTGEVDGAGGRLVSYDEREVPFDLLVVCPLHSGAAFVGRSPGLGDDSTSSHRPPHAAVQGGANIFAIGDADEPARVQGRVGDPLRGRDPGREHPPASSPASRSHALLRRARQLLRRDRVRQGAADRLQLRHRAAARPLPGPRRPAPAAQGVAAQPPRRS